jgi:hypothetical protein
LVPVSFLAALLSAPPLVAAAGVLLGVLALLLVTGLLERL